MIPRAALALVAACLIVSDAAAQSAADKGLQIAREAERRNSGYVDYTADGQMILRNSSGGTSERRFAMSALEQGGGNRTLLVFSWPGDIRDTALLTHAFDNRDDNQWLFLPAVRRAKRITGSGRSGSFVGSEFAYEDMVDQSAAKFDHLWIRDETCPGFGNLTCNVVDRTPRYRSGYSRQRVWFDTSEYRIIKVDFYDRRGAVLKTLTTGKFSRHKGRFWRAGIMRMKNRLTGKSSDLLWANFRFGVGLSRSRFSVNALQTMQ